MEYLLEPRSDALNLLLIGQATPADDIPRDQAICGPRLVASTIAGPRYEIGG